VDDDPNTAAEGLDEPKENLVALLLPSAAAAPLPPKAKAGLLLLLLLLPPLPPPNAKAGLVPSAATPPIAKLGLLPLSLVAGPFAGSDVSPFALLALGDGWRCAGTLNTALDDAGSTLSDRLGLAPEESEPVLGFVDPKAKVGAASAFFCGAVSSPLDEADPNPNLTGAAAAAAAARAGPSALVAAGGSLPAFDDAVAPKDNGGVGFAVDEIFFAPSLAVDGVAGENAKERGEGCASALLSIPGPGLAAEKVNAERRSVGLLLLASDPVAGDDAAEDAADPAGDGVGLGVELGVERAGGD
jgi:hypothetical protein